MGILGSTTKPFSVESLPPWARVYFLVLFDSISVAMYLFVFLKIRGQDREVYFLAVPSADWLRGVDARPSSPVDIEFHPMPRTHEQARRVRSMELEIRLASAQG